MLNAIKLVALLTLMNTLIWCSGDSPELDYSDYDLRMFLSNSGWITINVDYTMTDFNEAVSDIEKETALHTGNIVLVGVSNGGFLAHYVANKLKLPALLIHPILKPYDRLEQFPLDYQKLQLNMFHTKRLMKHIQDSIKSPNNTRFIIYEEKDIPGFIDWVVQNNVYMCSYYPNQNLGKTVPSANVLRYLNKYFT